MRTTLQNMTYTVEFDDADTQVFTRYTEADTGVVHGRGAFVFDSATGDLVGAKGTAKRHGGEIQWLSFSQDAQEFGRLDLARQGHTVNPFDFGPFMPELASNPKKGKAGAGRRVELVRTSYPHTRLRSGAQGTVDFADDEGTLFVIWDDGSMFGLVPGTDEFKFLTEKNPSAEKHVATAKGMLKVAREYLKLAGKNAATWKRAVEKAGLLSAPVAEKDYEDACGNARYVYDMSWRAQQELHHTPKLVELELRAGDLRKKAIELLTELGCGWEHAGPAANPDVARISRTRGVKTMRGPYSARKGYKPWITRRGKLGTGFLTTMSKAQRDRALDNCVAEYGYRSCLGSIMALERAHRGPHGTGEGVGVKYASKLRSSRDYLKKKYGGPGSFGPQKKHRVAVAARA